MVTWNSTKEFSIKAAWEVLYTHSPKVPWKHLVWFKYYIPRHSFILWLAIRRRLSTQDRLLSFGTIHTMLCHLCGDNVENHDHLFFGCPFSLRVWTAILAKCDINVSSSSSSWSATQIWACSTFKGSTLLSCIGRLSLAAAVYSLWRERNSRLHGETPKTEPMLITLIVDLVRMRLFDCSGFPNTPTNLHLVHSWHLPLSLIGG